MVQVLYLFLVLCAVDSLSAAQLFFDFETLDSKQPPLGFASVLEGGGKPGLWKVIEDEVPGYFSAFSKDSANVQKKPVLAQLSEDLTDERHPMLIFEDDTFKNGTFEAKFKLVKGIIETMAGLVFRYQDPQNYYYVRASGIGQSFAFFKVVNGQRGEPVMISREIETGQWYKVSVKMDGAEFTVRLNDEPAFPTLTDHTFTQGKIGFWTKSDSVSYFADPRLDYEPRVIPAERWIEEALKAFPRLLELDIFAPAEPGQQAKVIASKDVERKGQIEDEVVKAAITEGKRHYERNKKTTRITLPLADRNGDPVAALRVEIKSFAGQTRANALTRAIPIVELMQRQILDLKDLYQ